MSKLTQKQRFIGMLKDLQIERELYEKNLEMALERFQEKKQKTAVSGALHDARNDLKLLKTILKKADRL